MSKEHGPRVEQLNKELSRYERAIKDNRGTDNTYNLKAEVLKSLGQYTGNKLYYDQALEAYRKAIELSPQNSQYLVNRCDLYLLMGKTALAAIDLVEVQRHKGNSGNKVVDMYVANISRDILKLKNIQEEIEKLITNKQLSSEFECVFYNVFRDIADSSSIAESEKKLDKYQKKYPILKEEIGNLIQNYMKSYIQRTQKLEVKVQGLQVQVAEHGVTLEDHKRQLKELYIAKEHSQKLVEEIRDRINADATINEQNTELMNCKLKNILSKMQGLADKTSVEVITAEMVKLRSEAQFTQESLDSLEGKFETLEKISALAGLGLNEEQLENMKQHILGISNEQVNAAVEVLAKILIISGNAAKINDICTFMGISNNDRDNISNQFTQSEKVKNVAIVNLTSSFAGYEAEMVKYKQLVDSLITRVLELEIKNKDMYTI